MPVVRDIQRNGRMISARRLHMRSSAVPIWLLKLVLGAVLIIDALIWMDVIRTVAWAITGR